MNRFYSQFLCLVLIVIGYNNYAQNYQTFNSGRISYFEDENHYVKSARIDSVHFDTDSVLFPMGNIQQETEECFSPYGASWLGSKFIIKTNGDNIFFNKNNDTIRIKSMAQLNDTWIAFQNFDNLIITATVTLVDTMTFLNVNDSIKTLSFQVYDLSMTPINHTLNTFELILSKNYGIIKTLNFYNFPDLITNTYYSNEILTEYTVCGMSNPELGFQNVTWFDIFNFQVGDELHIRTFQETPDFEDNTTYTNEHLYKYKYLERTDSENSITYLVELTVGYNFVTSEGSGYEYYLDTITENIILNPAFDFLPGEVIVEPYSITYINMLNGFFKTKSDSRLYEFYQLIDENSNCYSIPLVDGCFSPYDYYENLGGPYYYCSYMPYSEDSRTLVYYNSNGTTWGTPLVISQTQKETTSDQFSLYPNPAKSSVSINVCGSNENYQIDIYNPLGSLVISQKILIGNNNLDVNSLPCGVYFYKIMSSNEVLKNGKFIKE